MADWATTDISSRRGRRALITEATCCTGNGTARAPGLTRARLA